ERCPDCGVVLQNPGTDKWMPIEEGTTAHTKERCLEHQLAAARTEAERWKQQYETLREGVERVVQVHRRIKGLEAKIGRQRAVISRLQAAVERRNSDERIEAMRRALYDETVERYMREYDA